MIFDKNVYRITELSRKLAETVDTTEQARIEKQIQKLGKADPCYFVRYRNPLGRRVSERVPDQYRGQRGAEKYEANKISEVDTGGYSDKDDRKAAIEVVCNFYLEKKMKFKKSYSSAKTLCNHIIRHMGLATLEVLDRNPGILVDHFNDFPEDWAPKYIWNYRLALRAAISFWIKMKRLHLANPMDLVELDPGTKVMDYVPTRQDFDAIIVTSLTLGLPDIVRHIYTAVYETGLRIGEILGWRIEEMDLRPPAFDDLGHPVHIPFFSTEISKQGRFVKIQIPMSRQLHSALLSQIGDRTYGEVFPIDQRSLYTLLLEAELIKLAKVPFTRPFHDFRKTVKHRLKIEQGLSKDISKGFMGHATDAMDDYYTHFHMFDLWAAVAGSWKQ